MAPTRKQEMPIHRSETGKSGEAGYTLVELLVVLAIMGLALAAVPALMMAAAPGLQSKAAARALASDLSMARSRAILRSTETHFVFPAPARSHGGVAFRQLPYGVPFTLVSPGHTNEIDFFADGSSSGGIVMVGTPGHQHRVVTDWLTGRTSVDE
jgi:general secretion pathway protein H